MPPCLNRIAAYACDAGAHTKGKSCKQSTSVSKMRWHVLHGTISDTNLGSHCCVRSGWHSIFAVWFAQIFRFRFSLVIVLVLVRSASCNFYSYIVFVSQIAIVLVFVLTERSAIILVFVFVTKMALPYTHGNSNDVLVGCLNPFKLLKCGPRSPNIGQKYV